MWGVGPLRGRMEKVNVQNQDLLHNPMAERVNVGLQCHPARSNNNKRDWLWSQGQMEWDPLVKVLWWSPKDLKRGFAVWVERGHCKGEEEQVHGQLAWRNLQRCGGTQSGRSTDTSTLQIPVVWAWTDSLSVTRQWWGAMLGILPALCATALGPGVLSLLPLVPGDAEGLVMCN